MEEIYLGGTTVVALLQLLHCRRVKARRVSSPASSRKARVRGREWTYSSAGNVVQFPVLCCVVVCGDEVCCASSMPAPCAR